MGLRLQHRLRLLWQSAEIPVLPLLWECSARASREIRTLRAEARAMQVSKWPVLRWPVSLLLLQCCKWLQVR